jgi:hypothetical protein
MERVRGLARHFDERRRALRRQVGDVSAGLTRKRLPEFGCVHKSIVCRIGTAVNIKNTLASHFLSASV